MGELEPWIDENFVRSLWFQMGEQVSVKMIRDKFSGYVIDTDVLNAILTPAEAMLAIASSILLLLQPRPKL